MEITTRSFISVSKYPTLKDVFEYIYESVNYNDVVISNVEIRLFDKNTWRYRISYIKVNDEEE